MPLQFHVIFVPLGENMDKSMLALLIIGLPGSGKTTLANKITKIDGSFILIDDPSYNKANIREQLIHTSKLKKNIIICDPPLCDPAILKKCKTELAYFKYHTFEIFFANDPDACQYNIKNTRSVNKYILYLSSLYDPPPNHTNNCGYLIIPVSKFESNKKRDPNGSQN